MNNKKKLNSGFGLLELIVAMALFMIVVVSGSGSVLRSYSLNRLADEETGATLYATEGLDATRSIANQDWANLSAGTYGVDSGSGTWAFSGSSNTSSPFTRQIVISDVYRDLSNNIVTSGGTLDPDTFKITSTAAWDFSPTRNNSAELVNYLTNFKKPVPNQANDLVVNIAAAEIGGGGDKELQGITLENTGTPDITIDKITVSWVIETGRKIEEVKIDGTTYWKHNGAGTPDGKQVSGTELDMDDFVLTPADGVVDIDKFKFDGNMSAETQFTITFTMSDGSTKVVVIDLTGGGGGCGATQADDFSINVAGANVGGGGSKELKGVTVQNISTATGCDVVIDKVTVTWTNTKKIQEVKLGGTKIWVHNGAGTPDGKQSSGTELDSVDYTVTAAAGTIDFNKFKFDGNMTGNTFGITLTLGDGSTESSGGFSP